MPKFVILGSCKHEPYAVLAMPNRLDPELYERDHEKAYEEACKLFHPAIDNADIVIVYAPEGMGDHTRKDMKYALKKSKRVVVIAPSETAVEAPKEPHKIVTLQFCLSEPEEMEDAWFDWAFSRLIKYVSKELFTIYAYDILIQDALFGDANEGAEEALKQIAGREEA